MIALSLCNELLADDGLSLDQQCEIAAALGYMGLELSLGSLAAQPHLLSDGDAGEIRQTIESHGLRVTGLHWLLAPYPELSITDPAMRLETQAVLSRLVNLCAALGGRVLVHGSPAQREPVSSDPASGSIGQLADFFAPIARAAREADVTYCIEPLSRAETPVINTIAEAARLVEAIGSPAFRTMIDTSAAGQVEAQPVAELLREWLPTGVLAHVQVNDTNRGAPGMGSDPFPDIVSALRETGWPHPVAIEPFRTCIDGTTTAAIGAATIRACWSAAGRAED
ncbi:sugar phosphate isomerase/epimerase family protein [Tropicimonas marinistellae]|uniref:sugar phosphate isomerase/epimerase family protein n=1 Tax=Tropicimonas marinistellae TaxID=1739787 RepID=UPI0008379880|nr:sugar phosphate isomerase/epimerase family protein [Tropicimonas marinistellae]